MIKSIFFVFLLTHPFIFSQEADSLIQLYSGLGDTLKFFDRRYLGLFPEIEGFNYAVFYVRNNDSLVTKIYTSENDSIKENVKASNLKKLDSLHSIIRQIDLMNTQLKNEINEFSLITKESNEIVGYLEMFDENYLYVIAENVSADHPAIDRYRIPVSHISEITLKGTSNLLTGICIGGAVGSAIGAVVMAAIDEDEQKQNVDPWESCMDIDDEVNAAAACVTIALGGFLVGTIVGISTSTDDNTIYFDSKFDVLKLKHRCAYVFEKGMFKQRKYFDIY